MTTDIYQGWLMEWEHYLQQKTPTRRVLLLQDNFSGHVVPDGLKCIRVENFRANLTAHVQPNDAGIIQCFKAHYRRHFYSRAIDRYEQGITPSDVYVINQLEAMRLAGSADPKVVEMERRHIQELIKEGGYNLRDIFNMDETGLFYACVALLCPNVHTLTNKAECHLTVDFLTRSRLVLKGKKTD